MKTCEFIYKGAVYYGKTRKEYKRLDVNRSERGRARCAAICQCWIALIPTHGKRKGMEWKKQATTWSSSRTSVNVWGALPLSKKDDRAEGNGSSLAETARLHLAHAAETIGSFSLALAFSIWLSLNRNAFERASRRLHARDPRYIPTCW